MFLRSSEGSVAILTVLSLAVFLGLLTLVLDLGYVYREKNRYKNAVDSASLAGVAYIAGNPDLSFNEIRPSSEDQARFIAKENSIPEDDNHLKVVFGFYDVSNEYPDFSPQDGFVTGNNFTEMGTNEFNSNKLEVNAVFCKVEDNIPSILGHILGRDTYHISVDSLAYTNPEEEVQQGIMYKWCHGYENTPEGCPYCDSYSTPGEHAAFPGGFHNYVEDVHLYFGGQHGGRSYYLFNLQGWGETHPEGQLSFFDEQDFNYQNAKGLTVYMDTSGYFDSVAGEHSRGGVGAVSRAVLEQVRYGGEGDDRLIVKTRRDNSMTVAPNNFTLVGGQNGLQCYLDGVEVYAGSTYWKDNLRGFYDDIVKKEFGDVRINHLPQGSAGNEYDYKLRVIAQGNIHIGHDETPEKVFAFNGDFVEDPSAAPLFLAGGNIIIDEASQFKNGYVHSNQHIILNYYDYTKLNEDPEKGLVCEDYPLGYNIFLDRGPGGLIYRNGAWQFHANAMGQWPEMGIEYPALVPFELENARVTCSDTVILRHRFCDPTGTIPAEGVRIYKTSKHYYVDEEVNVTPDGLIAGNQSPRPIPWNWETGETAWDWDNAKLEANKIYTTDYCSRDYKDVASEGSVSGVVVNLGSLN